MWVKHEDDRMIFRVDQPLEQIFAANHEAEAATHGRAFGDYVRVASVPHHLAYQNGLSEAIDQHDDKHVARILNDSDNSKFRTSRGRV